MSNRKGNVQNFNHVLTAEEKMKGTEASNRTKKENAEMRRIASVILKMSLKTGDIYDIEEIKSIAEVNGKNISVAEAIIIKQVEKALKGDLKSAEFIRDTSGQKPVEKSENKNDNVICIRMDGDVSEWGK